jgi:hypothetical protein
MKKLLFAIFIMATMTLTFSSCGKYEDGPKISFASKKSRLAGDWKVEKFLYNESDQTAAYFFFNGTNATMDIEKDGKYKLIASWGTENGTWKLGEDKDDVTFTPDNSGNSANTYRILRLKSKELWWKQTQSNGDVEETHFVPAD